jgi:hypothetical protein
MEAPMEAPMEEARMEAPMEAPMEEARMEAMEAPRMEARSRDTGGAAGAEVGARYAACRALCTGVHRRREKCGAAVVG